MIIILEDLEGNQIFNFELDSNPFKIGEEFSLNIKNNNPKCWDVEEVNKKFKIEKIEHKFEKTYPKILSHSINSNFIITIKVIEIEKK